MWCCQGAYSKDYYHQRQIQATQQVHLKDSHLPALYAQSKSSKHNENPREDFLSGTRCSMHFWQRP